MYPELSTREIIELAKSHLPALPESDQLHDSAWFCYREAEKVFAHGDMHGYTFARRWALKSLCYSVGVFHPDYARAKNSL